MCTHTNTFKQLYLQASGSQSSNCPVTCFFFNNLLETSFLDTVILLMAAEHYQECIYSVPSKKPVSNFFFNCTVCFNDLLYSYFLHTCIFIEQVVKKNFVVYLSDPTPNSCFSNSKFEHFPCPSFASPEKQFGVIAHLSWTLEFLLGYKWGQ